MTTATAAAASVQEPSMVQMTVTPAQAANWLEQANNHNRTLSDRVVHQYARDMKAGRWRLTHQGIAFDPRGNLLDGQHRLWAVVEAGVPVEMIVWFNIASAVQMITDVGRPRRLADNLRLGGGLSISTSQVLACLRAMLGHGACPALTPDEARTALERHSEALAFAQERLPQTVQRGITTAEVRAVIARAWYSADPARLARFCEVLRTSMAQDDSEKTIILLRTTLSSGRGLAGTMVRVERYGKTERALMAFLRGEPRLTRLYLPTCELFPLPEEEQSGK